MTFYNKKFLSKPDKSFAKCSHSLSLLYLHGGPRPCVHAGMRATCFFSALMWPWLIILFVCFFQQFFNLVSHQTTLQCRHNRICRLQEEIETGKVWRGSRQGPQMVSNTAQSSEKPQSGLWFYLYGKGKILQNLKKKGAMVMSICVVCSKEGGESRRCFL